MNSYGRLLTTISCRRLTTASTAKPTSRTSLKWVAGGLGVVVAGVAGIGYTELKASDGGLAAPEYKWSHRNYLGSFDHAAIRRGFQVYKQVCSSCHSMEYLSYRNLVGVSHTYAEARALAESTTVMDGPDDEGNMFERMGKLSDPLPKPYETEEAARAANNGAYPPDLSLITGARAGEENYIVALMTGYVEDPPAGIELADGMNFNAYFVGQAIAMAPPLYYGVLDYEDGTPATLSQMAKDVGTFLTWACYPELDERKRMGVKAISLAALLTGILLYYKRHKFVVLKSRKLVFRS